MDSNVDMKKKHRSLNLNSLSSRVFRFHIEALYGSCGQDLLKAGFKIKSYSKPTNHPFSIDAVL